LLLLITNSDDVTSDLLVERLGGAVFRLNFDIYKEYKINFSVNYWEIINPLGFQINSKKITSIFWWKAFSNPLLNEDNFVIEEVKYIYRELYNWGKIRKITKGNAFDFHNNLGKLNILSIAQKYFKIPNTLATIGADPKPQFHDEITIVAKSLSSAQTNAKKTMISTLVDKNSLDLNFPWFLQNQIVSDFDLTIFICGKKRFYYARSRKDLEGIDWRVKHQSSLEEKVWLRFYPNKLLKKSVDSFCKEIMTDWGRIDLMGSELDPIFLEFNANGQWVFLDYKNEDGLVDEVVRYIYN